MQKFSLKLLLAVVFLAFVPFFLRRRWRVLRRTLVRAKPEEIFVYLEDLTRWPEWTEWDRRENLRYRYSGPPKGVGATQRWSRGRMNGILRLTQSHPCSRLAYELEMGDGQYHINGTISLEPVGTFTRVTWICSWVGDRNPFARILDLIFKVWIGHDFEAGLANLRSMVEGKKTEPSEQEVS
jgi:hypothetical protein